MAKLTRRWWAIWTLVIAIAAAGGEQVMAQTSSAPPALDAETSQVIRKRLERTARPAILLLHQTPGPSENSRSWFGGLPRMPADLAWPRRKSTGKPMSFLAQIDLADLPSVAASGGLPAQGVLWVFAALDDVMEDREHVAVLYRPKSNPAWVERPAPSGLGPMRDESPYTKFGADDPRAGVDFRYPIRFVAYDTFDAWTYSNAGIDLTAQFDTYLETFRDENIRKGLGRAPKVGPSLWEIEWGGPGDEAWPQAGAVAEMAALQVIDELAMIEPMPGKPAWTASGLAARARIVADARERQAYWTARRFAALNPAERRDFRDWIAAMIAQGSAMPSEDTGGWRLLSDDLRLGFDEGNRFAAYEILAQGGSALATLPTTLRGSYDWLGEGEAPRDQMLGYGYSEQDAPNDHRDDVLLLQLGGGADRFWNENGAEMLHLWISPRDLAARRFDRVTPTLESD